MAFHTTLKLMLVSDDDSESDYIPSYDQDMTTVVMLHYLSH